MQQVGSALIRGNEVLRKYGNLPTVINIVGNTQADNLAVHNPFLGWSMDGYELVVWKLDNQGPPIPFKQRYGADSDAVVNGEAITTRPVVDFDAEELAASIADRKVAMAEDVMNARDITVESGITFENVRYQSRCGMADSKDDDERNVTGAGALAIAWMLGGGDPSSLRWHGGAEDFGWIAEDNSIVNMSAITVVGFGKAMAVHKSNCIFNAYALKRAIELAVDHDALDAIDINAGWPS